MKANVKQRQQFKRDAQAAETMLLYMLGELNKHEGFGKKRLQRMYDTIMMEMFKDVSLHDFGIKVNAQDTYQRFALDNDLTPAKFQERQKETIDQFLDELALNLVEKRKSSMPD